MALLNRRRLLWIAANVVAAVAMPLVLERWIRYLVSSSDASLPEGFSSSTFVLAFTAAWLVFLLLLNVSVVLFRWLSRPESSEAREHAE